MEYICKCHAAALSSSTTLSRSNLSCCCSFLAQVVLEDHPEFLSFSHFQGRPRFSLPHSHHGLLLALIFFAFCLEQRHGARLAVSRCRSRSGKFTRKRCTLRLTVIANTDHQLNLDVPPSLYWEARGKTCPLFVPGCRCGLGKAPILGGAFEGAQGSLVDPVARPLILREEPALPPWCFYREPPFGQHLPTEPEDDPFLLPPSPTIPSSRESSPLPDPGLDPVESQADVADAAVEESAAPIESITCYCGRPDSVENMIACGTDPHPGEAHDGGLAWFHQSCAGLEQVPAEGEHI